MSTTLTTTALREAIPFEDAWLASWAIGTLRRGSAYPLDRCCLPRAPGAYLLVYRGEHDLYSPVRDRWPVYAGSTVDLGDRLARHVRSLRDTDLDPADFVMLPLATRSSVVAIAVEAVLISRLQPVWNLRLASGFGSRPQGATRVAGQHPSGFDRLHPGRYWARNAGSPSLALGVRTRMHVARQGLELDRGRQRPLLPALPRRS